MSRGWFTGADPAAQNSISNYARLRTPHAVARCLPVADGSSSTVTPAIALLVWSLLALLLLANAAVALAAAPPELIPREVLFGNPVRANPSLSPDGARLAYLAPVDGVLNIWIRSLGQADDRPITADRGRGVMAYFWAPNGDQILYIQDLNGDENWRVYSLPATGGEPRDLTPFTGVMAQIIAVNRDIPDEILIGLNDRNPQVHDIHRLNLRTGQRTLELQNDFGAMDWGVDNSLTVRLASVPTPDGGFSIRKRAGREWVEIIKVASEDMMSTQIHSFANDNRTFYYTSSSGTNAAELRSYDLETGEQKVVARDPIYDVESVLRHPRTRVIQAVSFDRARRDWTILDPAIQPHFDALRQLNPGDLAITGRDNADRFWTVAFTQDRGPVAFYSYDTATRKGEFLFSHRPELDGLPLAEMKPISFTARDGRTIHGYLTLPPGLPGRNLPAILNVHGGPWYRDSWGFHPEAQWLANRGYACLQVNFRGSTGYGKEFVNAGDREWGGKMQDDISDGVAWLVGQGIADPKRVGIYGGSYGGYAALCGLTMTPELYACGVSMVGPSNLITFINTVPPYWAPMIAVLHQRVGHPEKDREFLLARSPLTHIDRLEDPLFIAQGANDPRVNREESIQIRDALQKKGKPIEYLEFPDEGHGFVRPENRLRFYADAERFLARHLGGRFEE